MNKLLYNHTVKQFMKSLRMSNDIRVSAKFFDALRRHVYELLQNMCHAEDNEKSITKFHLKTKRVKLPKDLVRASVVKLAVVEIRNGPIRVSKIVYPQINAYVAAVCRASVEAVGDAMTVNLLSLPPDPNVLPVHTRQRKTSASSSTANYKDRRRLSAKYTVTIQEMTLQGTMYPVSAYSDNRLKKVITGSIKRLFDHLGIHGDIDVNVYSIEVRA